MWDHTAEKDDFWRILSFGENYPFNLVLDGAQPWKKKLGHIEKCIVPQLSHPIALLTVCPAPHQREILMDLSSKSSGRISSSYQLILLLEMKSHLFLLCWCSSASACLHSCNILLFLSHLFSRDSQRGSRFLHRWFPLPVCVFAGMLILLLLTVIYVVRKCNNFFIRLW